jgi:hypothetical protein
MARLNLSARAVSAIVGGKARGIERPSPAFLTVATEILRADFQSNERIV